MGNEVLFENITGISLQPQALQRNNPQSSYRNQRCKCFWLSLGWRMLGTNLFTQQDMGEWGMSHPRDSSNVGQGSPGVCSSPSATGCSWRTGTIPTLAQGHFALQENGLCPWLVSPGKIRTIPEKRRGAGLLLEESRLYLLMASLRAGKCHCEMLFSGGSTSCL